MRCTVALIPVLVAASLLYGAANGMREISLADLRDKIEGGWAGQMIGVSFGAPTEFRYRQQIIEGDLPKWTPDRLSNALVQDDLYVDMTFAKVLDDTLGVKINSAIDAIDMLWKLGGEFFNSTKALRRSGCPARSRENCENG